MKKANYLLLFMTAVMVLASCKKGDQGPQGATGPKGVDGAAGKAGSPGPAGTANVIYSDWMSAVNFRDTTADNSKLKAADLPAAKLTAALLNNATVMVYLDFGGGVYTLPYTSYAGGKLNTISFWPRAGRILITRFTADNSGGILLSSILKYRYVIIPGGISAMAVANKVDIYNYESVRSYYGMK